MATTYTYPHWEISVVDNSIYTPLVTESLPLFRPIFFMRAQQGPAGIPTWVSNYTEAQSVYGKATFEFDSKYFSREALFLRELFARQGAFIVRCLPSDAQVGSLVVELRVKRVQVPQWERDDNGQYRLDENNERIPLTNSDDGTQVTEEGVELKWMTRPMQLTGDHVETLENLKPTTYGKGDGEYTVYPILACKASAAGEYANDVGVKLFVDLDNVDTTLAENVGALPYTFGAVRKTYGQDTVSPLYSSFDNQYEDFVAKPDCTDERVARDVSFDKIISNYYADEIPFEIKLYNENIKTIGELIQELEPEDETLFDPYMVNLCEPYNMNGVPMPHVVMSEDDDSVTLTDTRILYLQGGFDGTIDDASIEALTRQYLDDLIYRKILDQSHYPYTHIVDTGVSIDTKESFIGFLGKNDAIKVILSTQDANMGRLNTEEEDMSMGAALYADCLLQPESTIKGTECCRAEIYQHAGYLADSQYDGIVPFTYDIIAKKSRYLSTSSITGQAAGLPNSQVDVFKSWNWEASDPDRKQRSWDSGLNYVQYYDQTGIHWPAMRTVYRYDTSVLTSALFTDVVVFCKHIMRQNWSRYAGVEIPFETLATRATASVTNDLSAMLNSMFKFDVTFSQSEEEARIGYIAHATVRLWGNPQQRIWKVDIECYRNGYDPETVEETE